MTISGKRALITGITGQDGSYLAEFLLEKGYEVHGIIRRSSNFSTQRLDSIYQDPHERGARLFLHYGDLADGNSLSAIIRQVKPTEVYNLAAQSHVRVSFDNPFYTTDINAAGAVRLLEAVRDFQQASGYQIRYYQASSSEQFGMVRETPQRETTPFYPRSPYACSKLFAHWATINYRESYNLHASCGILFNHESPRRGETFVTRKITRAVGRIKMGMQDKLFLGNLEARRDWGFAGDYVQAMWMMLQQDQPGDFIIATGESISVREFAALAFARVDLDPNEFIRIDPRYLRPAEVDHLQGDASKAHAILNWKPATSVHELVRIMVDHDLELARRERLLQRATGNAPASHHSSIPSAPLQQHP
ncbi:MAG TPA: GDP-mannose 4,6-dehydratase [Phycisphaerales bacterium]|nr:GDP-mannose 4,6-dehydratase [Phycisphaerales bacterium]